MYPAKVATDAAAKLVIQAEKAASKLDKDDSKKGGGAGDDGGDSTGVVVAVVVVLLLLAAGVGVGFYVLKQRQDKDTPAATTFAPDHYSSTAANSHAQYASAVSKDTVFVANPSYLARQNSAC